ncbi:MAG: hypothetical protein R3Y50_03375 [Rikenellaceae bacterium]
METLDWLSVAAQTKVLLIGESSTLQWNDEVVEHAMFLDYYFDHAPYDLGERSRYSEATTIFEYLKEMTAGLCRADMVHGTLLSNTLLAHPPKGKRVLIPAKDAEKRIAHFSQILKNNPTIKYIFVMGLQTNYYLQKFGMYEVGELTEQFLKGAEPRRVGLESEEPFYQPVNAKPFREICFKRYKLKGNENIEVVPILPVKSYPLVDSELKNFGENFEKLKDSFRATPKGGF